MTRDRLPNRRPNETETLEVSGQRFEACVGFDPDSEQPAEVFLTGGKEGSHSAAMLSDAATIISVSIQYGVSLEDLAKSVGRLPAGVVAPAEIDLGLVRTVPASPIGAALDFMLRLVLPEPRVACKGATEVDHR